MWQVGTGNLVVLVKTFNCSEISLTHIRNQHKGKKKLTSVHPPPPIKKETSEPRRKVYLYQKGDYESVRKGAFEFAKEKYFNGFPDTRSVQENFKLITSFIQDSADKHILSKTNRTVSSVPWITSEIRKKIRKRNKTHAKAKKTGSKKLRSKFRNFEKDDVRKQHDLYVNNLVGDVKANPRDFYRYINSQRKDNQGIPPL